MSKKEIVDGYKRRPIFVQEGKHILHRYFRSSTAKLSHIFSKQDCWCNPTVTTDWTKASTGEPFVIVSHEAVA